MSSKRQETRILSGRHTICAAYKGGTLARQCDARRARNRGVKTSHKAVRPARPGRCLVYIR